MRGKLLLVQSLLLLSFLFNLCNQKFFTTITALFRTQQGKYVQRIVVYFFPIRDYALDYFFAYLSKDYLQKPIKGSCATEVRESSFEFLARI